ncbi:MAG TPA: helix-turn-helix transcriptional regulator, partial [Roseiarcus sp.]|nr:helix-turn-helix transcriptional regulator [Roseiarcus sp.]
MFLWLSIFCSRSPTSNCGRGMTLDQIDARRRAAGLSMSELCRRAGINTSTYQRTRQGKGGNYRRTLERLAAALENPKALSLSQLRRGSPEKETALIRATFRGWAAHFARET